MLKLNLFVKVAILSIATFSFAHAEESCYSVKKIYQENDEAKILKLEDSDQKARAAVIFAKEKRFDYLPNYEYVLAVKHIIEGKVREDGVIKEMVMPTVDLFFVKEDKYCTTVEDIPQSFIFFKDDAYVGWPI